MSNELKVLFDEIEKRGMTIATFAKKLGIPRDRVYQWRNGRGHPKGRDVLLIEEFLNESVVREGEIEYGKKLTALDAMVADALGVQAAAASRSHTTPVITMTRYDVNSKKRLLDEVKQAGVKFGN